MDMNAAEKPAESTNRRQNSLRRRTDLITVVTLLAIGCAYYFLPPLIEVLIFVGLLNVLIGTVLAKQSRKS